MSPHLGVGSGGLAEGGIGGKELVQARALASRSPWLQGICCHEWGGIFCWEAHSLGLGAQVRSWQ